MLHARVCVCVCCYIVDVSSWSWSDFWANNGKRKRSRKSFAREMRRHGWILDKTLVLVLCVLAEVKNSFVHPHCGLKIGANYNVSDLPFKSYVKSRFHFFCNIDFVIRQLPLFIDFSWHKKLSVGSMTQLITSPPNPWVGWEEENVERLDNERLWCANVCLAGSVLFMKL